MITDDDTPLIARFANECQIAMLGSAESGGTGGS